MLRCLLKLAIAATCSLSSALNGQSAVPIVGTLVDSANQTIAHAVVTIHATDAAKTPLERTLTGANGRLSGFSLMPGTYWVIVRRIGFKPDTQSLTVSASIPAPPFTMVVASVPFTLPPIVVVATQCTEFSVLARDSVLSNAWDLVETTIMSRAALYRNYEYEILSVDSSFSPERAPQWKVKNEKRHRTPSTTQELLAFNEPLYRITYSRNKASLQTGTEFGLLSPAFKANHCITLALDETNASAEVVRFQSLPVASKKFRVEGQIVIDRATSRMIHFSYSIFRNDAYIAHAYCNYGTTDVLGKAFPVLTQIGLIQLDPKNGQTISEGSSTPTYSDFRQVRERK